MKERWIVLIAACALIATFVFPPWNHYGDFPIHQTHGYFCFFDTMQGEPNYRFLTFKIDWPRLVVLDLIIASVGATIVYALRSKRH